jgi:hypothetical protein
MRVHLHSLSMRKRGLFIQSTLLIIRSYRRHQISFYKRLSKILLIVFRRFISNKNINKSNTHRR